MKFIRRPFPDRHEMHQCSVWLVAGGRSLWRSRPQSRWQDCYMSELHQRGLRPATHSRLRRQHDSDFSMWIMGLPA